MSIKRKTAPTEDILVGEGNVFVTVTIGNGHVGSSVVRWVDSDEPLKKGDIQDLDIGIGKDIAERTLKIVTDINDVHDVAHTITITHDFVNGRPTSIPYVDAVENDGDSFSLTTTYTFVS